MTVSYLLFSLLSLSAGYLLISCENRTRQKRSSLSPYFTYPACVPAQPNLSPIPVVEVLMLLTEASSSFVQKIPNPLAYVKILLLEFCALDLVSSLLLLDLSHQSTNSYCSCIKNNLSLDSTFPFSTALSFLHFKTKLKKKKAKFPISDFSPPINS